MSKIGKISVIKREYGNTQLKTMQSELAKNNRTRVPGTGIFKYPYKELDGKYRTGLDVNAAYIKRIQDELERKLEIERIEKTLKIIQDSLGEIDLGPRSSYWNYGLSKGTNDQTHVQPVKLIDGDNHFDLQQVHQLIAFSWVRVHPTVASSHGAWERGEYPADTQYYVADEEVETAIVYRKKKLINKAIGKFETMSPEKKKKVARLLGLSVTDNTSEELVYNQVDEVLKKGAFAKGEFLGQSTIKVFNQFADMKETLLHVRDLVKQAVDHSVYRIKGSGRVYEGDYELAKSVDAHVRFLMDEDNQEELLILEQKLKSKKLISM